MTRTWTLPLALASLLALIAAGCPDANEIHGGPAVEHDDDAGDDDADDDAGDDDCDDTPWFQDQDGDGYGDPDTEVVGGCEDPPSGWTTAGGDCDDGDPAIHPGAADAPCDGVDTDCSVLLGLLLDSSEYATLQDAIDAAADGATLQICPGTYGEALLVDAQTELHLTAASGDPTDTILDGAGSLQLLRVGWQVELLTVSHLTFREGHVGSPLTEGAGGAIQTEAVHFRAEDCVFLDNHAGHNGGAIEVIGPVKGDPFPTTPVELDGCHFEGNGAGYAGGAISTGGWDTVRLEIANCTFEDNHAGYEGGAIAHGCWGDDELTITGSAFSGNTAGYEGGAIATGSWSTMTAFVQACHFEDNFADNEGGAVSHGSWDVGDYHYVDTDFVANRANHEGGALNFGTWESDVVLLEGCQFLDNEVVGGGGGALSFGGWAENGGHTATLVDVVLDGNLADYSGAIRFGSHPVITVTLDGGAVTANTGTAVMMESGNTLHSLATDWGSGNDDNTPWDVDTYAQEYDFGAAASFTCTGNGSCL